MIVLTFQILQNTRQQRHFSPSQKTSRVYSLAIQTNAYNKLYSKHANSYNGVDYLPPTRTLGNF